MTSPTIERYLRVKLAHPGAVVFLVVGSFCQTFFDDAALCGRELRLAVRDLAAESEPEKILVCGFPLRVREKYVALLGQRGREVHVE
jgi:DNA mismatch repair protein MutS